MVDFLSSFGILIFAVDTWIVGEVEFSRIIFIFDLLFERLDIALTDTFLSAGFGKFSTAGFIAGIITVLALSFEAAFIGGVSVVRLTDHQIEGGFIKYIF